MKILELTNYSSGSCGVFARVKKEALFLSKQGHHVRIFSSNITKGTEEIAQENDLIGNVGVKRFPSTKIGGESFMRWNFVKEAIKFRPDVIISHSYRHYHSHLALKVAKKIGAKCILVTHAPFTMSTRSISSRIAVSFYDKFIGPKVLNKFDKVVAITKWETPYLIKLGCKKEKIAYIPNGIQDEFFASGQKKGNGIFFFGRISPIKNIELLIEAVKNTNIRIDIIGPAEEKYKKELIKIINKNKMKNIVFKPEVNSLKDKIKTLDKYEVLVLPSNFESFGQVLIEAMARGKIVVSSKTPGGKEIVQDGQNGFLFDIGNSSQLNKILIDISKMSVIKKKSLKIAAIKRAENFKSSKIFPEILKLL